MHAHSKRAEWRPRPSAALARGTGRPSARAGRRLAAAARVGRLIEQEELALTVPLLIDRASLRTSQGDVLNGLVQHVRCSHLDCARSSAPLALQPGWQAWCSYRRLIAAAGLHHGGLVHAPSTAQLGNSGVPIVAGAGCQEKKAANRWVGRMGSLEDFKRACLGLNMVLTLAPLLMQGRRGFHLGIQEPCFPPAGAGWAKGWQLVRGGWIISPAAGGQILSAGP